MTQNSPEPGDHPEATLPQASPQDSEWKAPEAWAAPEPWVPPGGPAAGWPSPQHGGPGPWQTAGPYGQQGRPQMPMAGLPPQPWPGYGPRPPQPIAYPAPARFEQVPGEKFVLAILPTPRAMSGVAVGSLSAGIGSILVSGAVWCFGLAGSADGWGGLVGGAFFVLSVLLGLAGVVLGILSLRQIKRAQGWTTGRGYGIAGLACGGVGLLLATSGLAVAIALSVSAS